MTDYFNSFNFKFQTPKQHRYLSSTSCLNVESSNSNYPTPTPSALFKMSNARKSAPFQRSVHFPVPPSSQRSENCPPTSRKQRVHASMDVCFGLTSRRNVLRPITSQSLSTSGKEDRFFLEMVFKFIHQVKTILFKRSLFF